MTRSAALKDLIFIPPVELLWKGQPEGHVFRPDRIVTHFSVAFWPKDHESGCIHSRNPQKLKVQVRLKLQHWRPAAWLDDFVKEFIFNTDVCVSWHSLETQIIECCFSDPCWLKFSNHSKEFPGDLSPFLFPLNQQRAPPQYSLSKRQKEKQKIFILTSQLLTYLVVSSFGLKICHQGGVPRGRQWQAWLLHPCHHNTLSSFSYFWLIFMFLLIYLPQTVFLHYLFSQLIVSFGFLWNVLDWIFVEKLELPLLLHHSCEPRLWR